MAWLSENWFWLLLGGGFLGLHLFGHRGGGGCCGGHGAKRDLKEQGGSEGSPERDD